LTGLIGQKGAAAVFHKTGGTENGLTDFIGGFVAVPYVPEADDFPNKATFSDWVRGFGPNPPPARLDNTNRKSEFLAGLATGLDTTGATPNGIPNGANPPPLTLDSARYNDEVLGGAGDEKDGYGFFFDNTDDSSNRVYYAGLLADTDLGAPLTESVTWYGQIQIIRNGTFDTNHPANDFTLEITFGMKSGVAGSVGSIEGFVEAISSLGNTYYQLEGTYDAGGVITGTVTFGAFTGSLAQGNLATTDTPDGILTGLIGEQGAVGVFLAAANIGEVNGSTKDNIMGVTSGGYVGGFVVAPPFVDIAHCAIRANAGESGCATTLSRPNAATWAQSFATELSDTPATNSTFVRGTADGVNLGTNLSQNLRTLNFNDVFDDGNMTDGLAFFITTNQAGIFSGTDLGAALPLTQRTSATWRGFIQANNGITTATEFELTVGFTGTGGTLVALIPTSFATLAYDINGTFDEKGVIGGNVVRGRYASDVSGCTPLTVGGNPNTSPTCFNSADVENATLTLSGIIGAEGAVGVFQGIAVVGNAPYSGGFLAKPPE
ncbi:MAG: hypothetical protein K8953_02790, partial [Proteobacteria bacterium]|nr:hypothetical protein [Pseudomonadota bacterium]